MSLRDLTVLGSSSQVPTRYRNHNAYLLRWDGQGLLFDPGEGTQRQFIFAEIAPTVVNRIFISHFHGDHCLGLAGIFQRLSLDNINHSLHIYFPRSGEVFVERMRYASIYYDRLSVVLHPIHNDGLVDENDSFTVEAHALDHPVDTYGFRITEHDQRRFDKDKLAEASLKGPIVGQLQRDGQVTVDGKTIKLEDVTHIRKGTSFAYILDTRPCDGARFLAKDADLIVMEGTYLHAEEQCAQNYGHMTVKEATTIAKEAGAKKLILTHFSQRYTNLVPLKTEAEETFPGTMFAEDMLRVDIPRNDD